MAAKRKRKERKQRTLYVRLPADLHRRLRIAAAKAELNVADYVRRLLERTLKDV